MWLAQCCLAHQTIRAKLWAKLESCFAQVPNAKSTAAINAELDISVLFLCAILYAMLLFVWTVLF